MSDMNKFLVMATLLMGTFATAVAQETWFCDKVGTKLTYVNKNGKKAKDAYQYVIKDKTTEGGKTTITYDAIVPKVDDPVSCNVWYTDKEFHIDAKSAMKQFTEGLTIKGSAPVIPMDPKLNEALSDCSLSIAMGNVLNTSVDYSNIKFTKHEEITVEAGTFDAWCMEYDTTAKVAFMKVSQHVEYWLVKGIGVVKQVVLNKKGKQAECIELQKIE